MRKPECRGRRCRRRARAVDAELCASCEAKFARNPGAFEWKHDDKPRQPGTGQWVTKIDAVVELATGETVTVTELVCRALRAGTPMRHAAAYAGIASSTFWEWLKLGRSENATLEQARFVAEIDKAVAECVVAGIAKISSSDDWRAQAWVLERRFPNELGPVTRVEHGNADGQPFRTEQTQRLDLSGLSLEQKRQMLALLEAAGADVVEPAGEVIDLDERRQIGVESSG